jgi:hypothetical protein
MVLNYKRPLLCRFCSYPVTDDGARVTELDQDKLSKWCLKMMDTELAKEGLGEAVFCCYCVTDAK